MFFTRTNEGTEISSVLQIFARIVWGVYVAVWVEFN